MYVCQEMQRGIVDYIVCRIADVFCTMVMLEREVYEVKLVF